MSYAMKISYPRKKFFTPFEEAMAAVPESANIQIMGYICGYIETPPTKYIQASIQSAKLEIKGIDLAISLIGHCLFGEKGKEKRRLKKEKAKWTKYISFLYEVMYFHPSNNLEESLALLKRHADITKFHPNIGKENHHE